MQYFIKKYIYKNSQIIMVTRARSHVHTHAGARTYTYILFYLEKIDRYQKSFI